jgi:hypothetical protein
MSRQYLDTSSPTVSGPSCSYATLTHYNNGSRGMSPPVPRTTTSGYYIVPAYGAPGYNTLMHDAAPSCSGYFGIDAAYRSKGGNCNQQYVRKLCQ